MLDKQEIGAAVLDLLDEMEGELGDALGGPTLLDSLAA